MLFNFSSTNNYVNLQLLFICLTLFHFFSFVQINGVLLSNIMYPSYEHGVLHLCCICLKHCDFLNPRLWPVTILEYNNDQPFQFQALQVSYNDHPWSECAWNNIVLKSWFNFRNIFITWHGSTMTINCSTSKYFFLVFENICVLLAWPSKKYLPLEIVANSGDRTACNEDGSIRR